MSAGFMPSVIRIFPNGEVDVDDKFYTSVMAPYAGAFFRSRFRAAASNYEKWFSSYQSPDDPESKDLLTRLERPFFDEFGISLEEFVRIVHRLRRLALSRQELLLRFDESTLMCFLKAECSLDGGRAARFLCRFSLPPRRAWNKDLPHGCTENDVWPWRFRRRLSLLLRPLVQLTQGSKSRWLVHAPLVERSSSYLLNGLCHAAFATEHFSAESMRQFCGEVANEQGHRFAGAVGDHLEELGYDTKREIAMTALGASALLGDLGDVDVMAWKAESNEVLIIECKHLRIAASVRDVVDRLEEYRGERDDSLGKHLRRFNWLKANSCHVSALTGIPTGAIQFRGLLVTDELVPMQFFTGAAIMPQDVVSFVQLKDVLK